MSSFAMDYNVLATCYDKELLDAFVTKIRASISCCCLLLNFDYLFLNVFLGLKLSIKSRT